MIPFHRDFIHERIENKADYEAFLVSVYMRLLSYFCIWGEERAGGLHMTSLSMDMSTRLATWKSEDGEVQGGKQIKV